MDKEAIKPDPRVIPYCTLWLGRPTSTIAYITNITKDVVEGYIQPNGGIKIPFHAHHDFVSFSPKEARLRFYFSDWNKLK